MFSKIRSTFSASTPPSQSRSPRSVVPRIETTFTQADAQNLKHICMVKIIEIFLACSKVNHSQMQEVITLFNKVRCIKITENVGKALNIITTALCGTLDEITKHNMHAKLCLPDIDMCLTSSATVMSDDDTVFIKRFYYSRSESVPVALQEFLEPIMISKNIDISSLLRVIKQSFELIEGSGFKFDAKTQNLITGWLKLEGVADAQNELLSSNSPQPRGRSDSAAAAALSGAEEGQSSSSATPSAAPCTPHLDPTHLYKFQTELWKKIALERSFVDGDSLRDKTQLISLLKCYCIALIVCMYGNPSVNKHELVAFYSELMSFQEKPTAQTCTLFDELINFLDDIISDVIAESNKPKSSAEQGGEYEASVKVLWDIPQFSDCVNLHIKSNQGVSLQDLCYTEAEQILASAISAATTARHPPTFEQLKHACLHKIAQLSVKVVDPTHPAYAARPHLLALHNALRDSKVDGALDEFNSYVQNPAAEKEEGDAIISRLPLELTPILGAVESSSAPAEEG